MNDGGVEQPKLHFCRLCGKHKPESEFKPTPLARMMDNTVVVVNVCELCQTVIHNIRQICFEAEAKVKERMQAAAKAKELETGGKIIIPSVMVPRNLKGPLKVN
jgi:hypothetical protein